MSTSDVKDAVLIGYSGGAQMAARAIESFPSMTTLSGDPFPSVKALASIGGGRSDA